HERSAHLEVVNFHGVDPPIGFTTHLLNAPFLRRFSIAPSRLNADNVFAIERVERFVPRLLANQVHYFLRNLFGIHSYSFVWIDNYFLKNFSSLPSALFQPRLCPSRDSSFGNSAWIKRSSVPPSQSDSSTVTT